MSDLGENNAINYESFTFFRSKINQTYPQVPFLFRKIRHKIMQNLSIDKVRSKLTAYLPYAIGEIILVVIGILIAISFDNSKRESSRQAQEAKILEQVATDLQSNTKELDQLLNKLTKIDAVADSVLKSLKNKKESKAFFAEVSLIHTRFFFTVASAGYTQLQGSQGVVVKNDPLRYALVELYENYFFQLARRQERIIDNLDNQLNPLTNARFKIKYNMSFNMSQFDENSFNVYEPINFESLTQDIVYANTIINQKKLIEIQIIQLKETIAKLTTIQKLIS
ncbi:MAG: DUF6090 family protein [Cyclobacteriaceae bacterium]